MGTFSEIFNDFCRLEAFVSRMAVNWADFCARLWLAEWLLAKAPVTDNGDVRDMGRVGGATLPKKRVLAVAICCDEHRHRLFERTTY